MGVFPVRFRRVPLWSRADPCIAGCIILGIFAFQANNITGRFFHVPLLAPIRAIAVPITLQVYLDSSLAYGLMRLPNVRPEAITVMNEIGIDSSGHRSKSVNEFTGNNFDYVITVCDAANEACPAFPGGTKRLHWSFEDPAAVQGTEDERKAAFRNIRDRIDARIMQFIADDF